MDLQGEQGDPGLTTTSTGIACAGTVTGLAGSVLVEALMSNRDHRDRDDGGDAAARRMVDLSA